MVSPKPHNHSFGYNAVHIVFVTKYRHPVINQQVESRLRKMFIRLCQTQDSELIECKADLGKQDHIHLLIDLNPKISLAKLVNILKTISSREIRKEFKVELKPYYWKPVFWKRGYGYSSSGGAPIKVLKRYIQNQGYED
ncbi:MAG: IS200/IS605 family transposase [Cyanobacteriota bacterium]|nr:IS200/IS605 family transposase [Cyanobacteriota bacterium]